MATRLIKLEDGVLVEVDVNDSVQQISGIKRVDAAIDSIKPLLLKTAGSLGKMWNELGDDIIVSEAEIEFGVSFEGEGNLYITKATTGANLNIKLTLKSNRVESDATE